MVKNTSKILLLQFFILFSCQENETTIPIYNSSLNGSSIITFNDYEPLKDKPINLHYYIPDYARASTPIVFVFHGNRRNAKDYRDATIAKAKEYGCIIVAPEFSRAFFPSGNQYNLGNVFVNGENPSEQILNPVKDWTFSIIEPIFTFLKSKLNNYSSKYHIIGHSAGSQFAHRFLQFKNDVRVDKVVLSAAGWYTVTDSTIKFPYGIAETPIEKSTLANFFNLDILIQVGELDNDNNAGGLRRNSIVDQQGLNRFERANHFFNLSKNLANQNNVDFNWQININQGLDHSFRPALEKAMDHIFKR